MSATPSLRRRGPARVGVAIAVLAAAQATVPAPARSTEPPARPNFVVIVTDDQRWDTVGKCLNGFDSANFAAGADACMPNLQGLMANGTTFAQAHVTTALCCPSRAGLLTGLYARNNGVTDNHQGMNLDNTETLNAWLDRAGYRTGLVGKWLNGYGDDEDELPDGFVPPGWDWWTAFYGNPDHKTYELIESRDGGLATTHPYQHFQTTPDDACVEANVYATDLLCARALQFLAEPSPDPFLLYFAPHAPHAPFVAPDRHQGWAAGVERPVYPSLNAVPTPNTPAYLPKQPAPQSTLDIYEQRFRRQLEMARGVDDGIGAIRDALAAAGRLETTVWVYLSDNGLALGEQRIETKNCIYKACHRVPMVMVCPPAICSDAVTGQVLANVHALNIDVAPTLAELADVTPGREPDGRSLLPLLRGDTAGWRTEWLFEDNGLARSGVVARLSDGHLYKYAQIDTSPQEELYDLSADPWELTNLARNGSYARRLSRLRSLFESWEGGSPSNDPPTATIVTPPPDALLKSRAVTVSWTSSDDVAVVRNDVFERVPPATGTTRVQSSTGTSFARTGALGNTYCYVVTAVDGEGATGSSPERCAAVPHDDRSTAVVRTGTLEATSASTAYQGTLMRLDATGDSLALSFSGRKVGVLARTTSSSGKLQVWMDGMRVTTVDLYSSTTKDKVYVYTASLPQGSHTLKLVWDAARNPSSTGGFVFVDGIAVVA